jgi:diaminohydroxyphosphoribosylaminopyrimidine deaminase/5-amino-6-(5-phosphoribosylamino)uracil reductase
VVIAMLDPNPAVAGRGAAALKAAGIVVEVGLGGDAAERLNRFYLTHMRTGRPFVTAKFAASLDGRIATRTGDSRWISSEASRTLAHRLRERHDAVLVGVGTVLADDPALTVRIDGAARQPRRVVVDSELRTPPSARLFASAGGPILIATTDAATPTRRTELARAGAEVLVLPAHNGSVDLGELLNTLGARQVISVLAEGGAHVLGSLRDERLIDSVVAILAPRLIGGADATPAIGGVGAASLADTLDLTDIEVERLGGDVIVTGYSVR